MRIALIGYGTMGKTIEKIALNRGHEIVYRIDETNTHLLAELSPENTDAAIEFTAPSFAFNNVRACIAQGVPVVCGTTGWLDRKDEADALCREKDGAFFYASNFSIGVNIFFRFNEQLAAAMDRFKGYEVSMEEVHHTRKVDAPSGTAVTLAEGVLAGWSAKTDWALSPTDRTDVIPITAVRKDDVPGTHSVSYNSEIDNITICHTAHNRQGFAAGAVAAAEWLGAGNKGVVGMNDMLKF